MNIASNQAKPTLSVAGVSFSYADKQALKDVSIEIAAGTFTALLGPNGAGKSTLYSLITRLLGIRHGHITICGYEISKAPESALERVGIVFQQPTLDLDLTVKQNLHYFAALRGISRSEASDRIHEEILRLDIGDIADKTVRQLNGGHRRRIELARALLHQPSLLLLDEPTVGLDVPTRLQFVSYVHSLSAERNVSVLWATHLIDEIDVERDNLVILHQGQVAVSGSTQSVIDASARPNLADAYQAFTQQAFPRTGAGGTT